MIAARRVKLVRGLDQGVLIKKAPYTSVDAESAKYKVEMELHPAGVLVKPIGEDDFIIPYARCAEIKLFGETDSAAGSQPASSAASAPAAAENVPVDAPQKPPKRKAK